MKRKALTLLLLISLFSSLAFGQSADADQPDSKIGIKASYFGEFVLHPGFAIGIDYSIHQKRWFNLHWDTEIGGYTHKWNNNALFIQSTIGTRFISAFSAFVDLNIGLGYMLTAPSGDVYVVDENGNLTNKGRPITSHLKPNISLLFGWDGGRKKDIPLIIQTGIEAYWQSGFNHSMLPHAAWRLGVIYKLRK